jgi:hypothetical protein
MDIPESFILAEARVFSTRKFCNGPKIMESNGYLELPESGNPKEKPRDPLKAANLQSRK